MLETRRMQACITIEHAVKSIMHFMQQTSSINALSIHEGALLPFANSVCTHIKFHRHNLAKQLNAPNFLLLSLRCTCVGGCREQGKMWRRRIKEDWLLCRTRTASYGSRWKKVTLWAASRLRLVAVCRTVSASGVKVKITLAWWPLVTVSDIFQVRSFARRKNAAAC